MLVTITNSDAYYAFDIVKKICTDVGPGLPGSPQERQRAAIIKRELETYLGAENVTEEEFTLAPDAFLTTYPGVFYMLLAIKLLRGSIQVTSRSWPRFCNPIGDD